MDKLSRTPPVSVRRQLRREVGFGCPVSGCGCPYLEYHHFDPEWSEFNHHNPDGMIALCQKHHSKAGAWTLEQCRELKRNPNTTGISGRFEWMRRELVAIVGGNYYLETPNIVVIQGVPVIWFDRDPQGYLLLGLRMLSVTGEPRAHLLENDWEVLGSPVEVESPPSGSLLRVRYENGDDLRIKFKQWGAMAEVAEAHPAIQNFQESIAFPLVTAEISMSVAGTDIRFDAKSTQIGGLHMTGNTFNRCGSGLVVD